MVQNLKQYLYTRQADPALDAAFDSAAPCGRVKLAAGHLFWKAGLRWYQIPLSRVTRAFRRVEYVYGKMCCGRASYDIQSLVLVLEDGTELEILMGDSMKNKAEEFFDSMRQTHPELEYGKPAEAI